VFIVLQAKVLVASIIKKIFIRLINSY